MKKVTKKIYAILLIILMLMNYIPIIVTAAETDYLTLSLQSTASQYAANDTILVDVKIDDIANVGEVKEFNASVVYDNTHLQLEEVIVTETDYSNMSEVSTNRLLISKLSGEGTLGVGDIICTLRFTALQSSDTQTTVKLNEVDATCNSGNVYYEPDFSVGDGIVNEPEITLPVAVTKYTHNLKITKTNSEGVAITNNSALFKIADMSGNVNYAETAEDGTITLSNLDMSSTGGTYTINEILAPDGYIVNTNTITVEVTFNEDGTLNSVVPSNCLATIDNELNTIDVTISNEAEEVKPEQEVFNLVINKVDEQNNSITTDTTNFDLTTPEGVTNSYSTDEATGKTQNIALVAPNNEGTYTYIIKETKAPSGYVAEANNIIVELTFEKVENKIVLTSGKIVSYNNEAIELDTSEDVKSITVNIKNEQEITTYNYTININKVKNDTFGTNITEDSAIFEVEDNNGVTYVKTNALGNASYNFSMTNKEIGEGYTCTIKEVKAPNGYILDETEKTVTLTFSSDGTISAVNVGGTNITTSAETANVVNVQIVNEEESQEVVLVPQDFDLVINKVDESNNLITSDFANFVLTDSNGTKYSLTTTNGTTTKVTLSAPNTAGKQVYFLKETKAPEGYDILEQSLIIEANFVESEGKIVLSNATISEYNKTITPSNNTLTIDVTNTRQVGEQEPQTFIIKIDGVDGNNSSISSGTTVIKLTNKETGEYIYKEVQISNGTIELDMPNTEGTVQYEIEQIKAPEGYETNPNPVEVSIDFEKDSDGTLKLSNYTVNGVDVSKGTSEEENTVSLVIVNNAIVVEPEKENYSIEINKLDSETNELITTGSAIFTVVDSNGVSTDYATTDGKVIISGIIPGEVGETQTFVIKEKTAPNGYQVTAETVIVKVSFTEIEGKIVATNPQLIMGESIATIIGIEENNIKINVINEKEVVEEEDLYVISKKYANGIDIYDLFKSYTGSHYTIDSPFIDTKEAVRGNNVSVQTFIDNLESNGVLTVWDKNGNQVSNSSRIKTGMTLKATKGEQEMTFTIVVKGDADGDGRVRTVDVSMLEKHLTKGSVITDPIALRALDLCEDNGDGIIRTTDLNKFYKVLTK